MFPYLSLSRRRPGVRDAFPFWKFVTNCNVALFVAVCNLAWPNVVRRGFHCVVDPLSRLGRFK